MSTLLDRIVRLEAALSLLLKTSPLFRLSDEGAHGCVFCDATGWQRDQFEHYDDCPWAVARAMLARDDETNVVAVHLEEEVS